MTQKLVIRNHTADALELLQIEHLGPCDQDHGPRHRAWRPTALLRRQKRLAKSSEENALVAGREIDPDIEPAETQQVHELIEAFSETQKSVQTTILSRLRLVFEHRDGVVWPIEIAAPTSSPSPTAAITYDHAGLPYTVIYRHQSFAVTFFDRYDPGKWMQSFPDSLPLSALSIPGTHNSPACHQALPSVRCQVVPIATQLAAGIRYLDIRVQVDGLDRAGGGDGMQLVHSVFPISFRGPKPFSALIKDVYHFLQTRPSETIIMSLKREGRGGATDADFAARLKEHYTASPFWYKKTGIPTLGEARGKIVVLRRFALGRAFGSKGFGIDATNWADNAIAYHHGEIHIQDFYSVTGERNIVKKIKAVTEHLDRAAAVVHPIDAPQVSVKDTLSAGIPPPLYINHLSANNFWTPGCWPDKIAAKLNPAVLSFLCEGRGVLGVSQGEELGGGTLGVVVCDWVGDQGNWDLVRAIIGTNSRLLARINQKR